MSVILAKIVCLTREVEMNEARGISTGLIVGLVALVGIGVMGALFFLGGSDEKSVEADDGDVPAGKVERADRLREKGDRLKAVMAAKRNLPTANPIPEGTGAIPVVPDGELTMQEKAALLEAVESIYNPRDILDALNTHSTVEYMRELDPAMKEVFESPTMGGRPVPVEGSLQMARSRISVLRGYVMSVMHCGLPAGQEEKQWGLLERTNEQFDARVRSVNDAYPFLGLKLVESP